MTMHQTGFQERLARINAGQGFTKSTIYVGLEGSFTYVPPNRCRGGSFGEVFGNAGYALSFPFCLLVGFLSHGLHLYAQFVLAAIPDPNANVDVEMAKTAMVAVALTIIMTHLLGLRDKGLLIPKLLGPAMGMLFFHNFVHLMPDLFGRIFSPIWVAQVTSATEAGSLFWRGISFTF